jgi:choline dehydrogenase-like flavoprotein
MAFADVVIVGSGFGAAVMAARLGAALQGSGRRILVLEKGNDHTGGFDPASAGGPLNAQGNRFRHSFDPQYLAGVGDLYTDVDAALRGQAPTMNVVTGKGLGGGSNLYCGVSLRAPGQVFEQTRDGRRLWPSDYGRAALDPYYAMVEERLHVHRMRWTDRDVPHWQLATKRDLVFAEGCRRIGATAVPLKIADDHDANEGWWTQGQRFRGRQNLTGNYLRDALDAGVTFQSGSEVTAVAPTPSGYVVSGLDRRTGRPISFEIECRLLVLGAGSVATSTLLLRSQEEFTGDRALPDDVLGRHLSANGDYGVTGIVGRDHEAVEGHKGKPMSSFCPSFWAQHQFVLIPFFAPALHPALGQFSTFLPAARPSALGRRSTDVARGPGDRVVPDWGRGYKETLSLFGARVLTMGCLTLDQCEGQVRLASDGETGTVEWNDTDPATELRWNAAVDTMRRIYEALGGEMFLDGYRKDGTVHTAHPLGGCRMSETAGDGLVDPRGEVWGNPDLFVVDGAVIPSALGVNPSLTIAAVAERIADRLVRGEGGRRLVDRLG